MLTTKAKEVERVLQCDLQHFAIEQMSLGQRKALNDNVEVTLDLTKKKRYNLITSANKIVQNIESVKFCYIDVNCRPKIKWSVDSVNDDFFHSLNELRSIFAIDG